MVHSKDFTVLQMKNLSTTSCEQNLLRKDLKKKIQSSTKKFLSSLTPFSISPASKLSDSTGLCHSSPRPKPLVQVPMCWKISLFPRVLVLVRQVQSPAWMSHSCGTYLYQSFSMPFCFCASGHNLITDT